MTRVLVTGAAGFIGSNLAKHCLSQGRSVLGIDSLNAYYDPAIKRANVDALQGDPAWTFVHGDLNDLELRELIADADQVIHLAAQPGVRPAGVETFQRYVNSNVLALQRLLDAAIGQTHIERFVFASSSSVYGDAERLPTDESSPLEPVSPYGATKVLGEHLCRQYHVNHDLPIVMLRYFTVYGPGQRPDMAFNKLIRAALNGEEIKIYGNGEQTRDFTFVDDAAAATAAAADRGVPGRVYNIGGGDRTSLNEALAMIGEICEVELNLSYMAAQVGDARHTASDTTLAAQDLGFSPTRSLREGLGQQVSWQRGDGG